MLLLLGSSQDVFYGHAHGRAHVLVSFELMRLLRRVPLLHEKPCLDVFQDASVLRLKINATAIDRFFKLLFLYAQWVGTSTLHSRLTEAKRYLTEYIKPYGKFECQ